MTSYGLNQIIANEITKDCSNLKSFKRYKLKHVGITIMSKNCFIEFDCRKERKLWKIQLLVV